LIQLLYRLEVNKGAGAVPDLDSIVDAEPRGKDCCHEEAAIGGPFEVRCPWGVKGGDLVKRASVIDVRFAREVSVTGKKDESAVGVEGNCVHRGGTEIVEGPNALVKKHGLGWHICGLNVLNLICITSIMEQRTSIDNAKLFRVWTPGKVVDRTFLVKSNAAIEIAGSTQEEHSSLSIVTLVAIVDLGLRQDQNLCAKGIPLDLSTICLEESLLARGRPVESKQPIHLNAGGRTL
jgi:hypothetical protein